MSNLKSMSIGLLAFMMISTVFVASVKANAWPSLPSTVVTMQVEGTPPDGGPTFGTYFDTTLSNVPPGYDVTNGLYPGWCVDLDHEIARDTPHQVLLYSSYNPPAILTIYDWNMVNYILNHKKAGATMMQIQLAIWHFVAYGFPPGGYMPDFSNIDAWDMINDANTNGAGYIPSAGDVLAVICLPEDWMPTYNVGSQISIIEISKPPERYPKQFTSSFGFGGFAAPEIIDDGLNTTVVGLHSGPRVSWNVTYYFANTEEFLGSEYDGEAHYFRMWDKWGGNLMALDSTPVAFNEITNIVTLADGTTFEINYAGYAAYIGSGLPFTDSRGGNAMITLHTGDQQQGTNPGKGKWTLRDGSSYDADLVWDIGYLGLGQSALLTIVIAPGKNPAGKLQFSSPGFQLINTGPRTRVYSDAGFTDFLYAIDQTIQLGVLVTR